MYAEAIYAELKDDILREDEDLEYEADDFDDVEDKNSDKQQQTQEEILAQQLLNEEAMALLESEMQKGEAPATIERFFHLDSPSKIDWREELKMAIDRYFRDDYTLLPPSKKLLYSGIYLPSTISQTFRLVIAIDSSGSVDEVLLSQFLSEVNFLMALIPNYEIEMLVCDDTIQTHKSFQTGEQLDITLRGGGATDFRPVFEFVEQNFDDVKLLLYFTDLEGIFQKKRQIMHSSG